tara:strand:- start:74 stop:553 length:480 start_codon:yes stop_codon:yes gene_type:complete
LKHYGKYLKKHTEALIKDVGIERACHLTAKSKTTLGRYYSDFPEHADRFISVDSVANLESKASFPYITIALAELSGTTLSLNERANHDSKNESLNSKNFSLSQYILELSQRFAILIGDYHQSMEDGKISFNEGKRLHNEAVALQEVLTDIKLQLENMNS